MIEYLEDSHTYVIDGEIVPCVSDLVNFAVGGSYTNVPETILQRAAEYGTNVHEAIQIYEEFGIIKDEYATEVARYMFLKKIHGFKVKEMETMVAYKNLYAGRFDIALEDGSTVDIKTTSKLYKDKLEWQIGLYNLARGVEQDGYAIWIPKKGVEDFIKIKPHTNEECIGLVEAYYEEQKNKSIGDNS